MSEQLREYLKNAGQVESVPGRIIFAICIIVMALILGKTIKANS